MSVAICRAFTITAVAQLCVLGITWIFGCFQFDDRTMIMSYLFTISGSLQGVMMFVFHCLFSKQVGLCEKSAFLTGRFAVKYNIVPLNVCKPQVREEYGNIFSRLCAPSKKRYSEFSSLSSKPQVSVYCKTTTPVFIHGWIIDSERNTYIYFILLIQPNCTSS